MKDCTQFTEHQIVRILCKLNNLEHVDASYTQGLQFCNALNVVCLLKCLRWINLEAKYPQYEKRDWQRLVSTFLSVQFGHSISIWTFNHVHH